MTIKSHYNVIVVGLGAMGTAALYHLAQVAQVAQQKNISILGIDQFDPPHDYGSSHGQTRVTRLANGEGDEYSKLALYARSMWQDLENYSGKKLLIENGILIFGDKNQQQTTFESQNFLTKTIEQAQKHMIDYQVLDAGQLAQRYSQFNFTGSEIGYYEQTGGFLFPEKCIAAQLDIARKMGAHTRINTVVTKINFKNSPIVVSTDRGDITCDKVIISAGSWLSKVVPEFKNTFDVYRQIAIWFKLKETPELFEQYKQHNFPTFKWKFVQGNVMGIYGFPIIDNNVIKIGIEDYNNKIDIKSHTPLIDHHKVMELYEQYIKDRMPMVSHVYTQASACVYTTTNDWKFVIDYHPDNNNVIIASPCSGHGFKHSIGIGKILANMCTGSLQPFDLAPFALSKI